MSDFNSSLPVRTENAGDVIAKISDATTPSQQLAVDSSGRITSKLNDGAGNSVTSQVNGSQQALDVGIDVAGVQIDPRQIRALTSADVVTANQGTAATAAGGWPVKPTDGTNSQSFTAGGEAKVDLTSSYEDHNFGTVGGNTLRTASQVGNATGAADFNNGATGAQTLRTAANLAVGGANVTAANPVPVSVVSSTPGTPVQSYQTSASLAAGGSVNLDYTVTAGKTLSLARVFSTASGKIKSVIAIETGVATGVFTTKMVGFNSTATPNIDMTFQAEPQVAAGVRVRVTITNDDKQAFDVYETTEGSEI